MAKNYFKSYTWLLETLQSHGPLTLKEIKELWLRSSINEERKELATRTFANHVAAIADIFGIDIVCERSYNTYYIENLDDIGGNSVREWMLDALSLNSLLNESATLRDRVFFEHVPSNHKYLATIIQAIRDSKKLAHREVGIAVVGHILFHAQLGGTKVALLQVNTVAHNGELFAKVGK